MRIESAAGGIEAVTGARKTTSWIPEGHIVMCGRYNISDDPYLHALCRRLGIDVTRWDICFSADVSPGATVSIIRETEDGRRVDNAIWWLVLEPTESGMRPMRRFPSFNTKWDRLNEKRSAGYKAFRESRCIIPASGFVEGLGDNATYHQLDGVDSAIAFGGLCRSWTHHGTGELVYSTSIITLPPHEKFRAIHDKAFPMMLDVDDRVTIDRWLDPEFHQVERFTELLKPRLVTSLKATPIDRPSKRNSMGEPQLIPADDR